MNDSAGYDESDGDLCEALGFDVIIEDDDPTDPADWNDIFGDDHGAG